MAEPVGTTLGALGVVGLLSVCLDCFNLIQDGRSIGKDFALLQTDFASQHFRFHVWARTSGFVGEGNYDRRLDSPEVKVQVRIQLEAIALLFMDARKVVQRYQIVQDTNQLATTGGNVDFIEEGLHDFLQRIKQTKRQAGFLGAIRWAIKDKTTFETLLQRLRNCIDALNFVTEKLDLFKQESLQQAVEIEIERIDDVDVLRSIASSSALETSMPNRLISDAASQRITIIEDQHTNDVNDNSSRQQTFATAPEEQSVQQTLELLQENHVTVTDEMPNDHDIFVENVLRPLIKEYCNHSNSWAAQKLSFDRFSRTGEVQAERDSLINSARSIYDEVITESPPWVLERLRQLTVTVEETIVSCRRHNKLSSDNLRMRPGFDNVEFAHDCFFKFDPVLADVPAAVENVTLFQLILSMLPPNLPPIHPNYRSSNMRTIPPRHDSSNLLTYDGSTRLKGQEVNNIGYFWAFIKCLEWARNSQRAQIQGFSLSEDDWGAQLGSIPQLDVHANAWVYARPHAIPKLVQHVMMEIKLSAEPFMSTRVVRVTEIVEVIVTFEGPLQSPYRAGVFQLNVKYPLNNHISMGPPTIRFLTRVYHPNVDHTGKVCVNFFGGTDGFVAMSRIVIAIISLLSDPEIDEPLVPEIASTYLRSREEYEQNAAAYTKKYATIDAALERYDTSTNKFGGSDA
ncbi:ubiquitin conjugating enzyme Ubc4 [Apiospora arundinis]